MNSGLYLITNDAPFDELYTKLSVALATGIAYVQYRRKHITPIAAQYAEARQILQLCQQYQVPLIINDDIELAQTLGCGVHLGQSDGSIQQARRVLAPDAIIGKTCHDSLAFAMQAINDGASYIALGAVFASPSKPNARLIDLSTLVDITHTAKAASIPICAIGGLTPNNIAPLKVTGVQLFAVISNVFDLPIEHIATRVMAWQMI